ncbi:hypothetical protein QBC43DRAFT_331897 [Cladorrhinum sp. PSN259]|nr:hypothetical protein QBC43DRAFT_331897 [Cladorrhinum sp. PSN259]
MGNGYYYEEQARMEYTRPPPRAYYASTPRQDRMVVEVTAPPSAHYELDRYESHRSPSPTRVVVVEKHSHSTHHKRRPRRPYEEPELGCWAAFCASCCCCCICCGECLDDTCCPIREYD